MLRVCIWLLALGTLLCLGAQREKPSKGPDLEVLQIGAQRAGGDVAIDGKVKNVAGRPHNGLVLLFDFLATGNQVITTKKFVVDTAPVAPEGEADFNVRVADPVRAVWIRVRATDRNDRELRVANSGPFTIE